MKSLKNLLTNKTFLILLLISILSLSLNFYKKTSIPACINADEAAFGYNSYSILKTGADEYGTKLPTRLKSFGDYKMPLYSYLSLPIIGTLGLNELSTRLLNSIVALLFPILIYFLNKEFFENKNISLVASFLTSTSLALHIIGRQAHEGYITAFLSMLVILFFVKIVKKPSVYSYIWFLLSVSLLLFSYQSSRLIILFLIFLSIVYLLQRKFSLRFLLIFILVSVVLSFPDLIYKPERVKNLLFLTNSGFLNKVQELRIEGGTRFFYNKVTIGLKTLLFENIKYYSPQFLITEGDRNLRFGFSDISLMTIVEYIFIFIGIYYLFKNRQKHKGLLLSLSLFLPLPASLSWLGITLPRSLALFPILIIISSYGIFNLFKWLKKNKYIFVLPIIILMEFVFLYYSWDFYFNHYPKRAIMTREWQCGYKELAQYVRQNYDKYDKFYITPRHGQPYIFLLYYLRYPPQKYQTQANLTIPDQYGFGQIKSFDKFIFNFPRSKDQPKAVVIGFPDEFINLKDKNFVIEHVKKIKIGTEEIFWVYENKI